MEVKIIGNGAWGKAIYSVVKKNTPTASFLLRGEKATVRDVLILSVPTQSIREALQLISFKEKHGIVINTAKGIEKNTHFLPQQIVSEAFGEDARYYSLIGPSFANEVVDEMPTIVNLGYTDENPLNQDVRNLFLTPYFRVRLTQNIEALELSGAFKNIYAIACGFANGLGYGANTRAKLLVLAIEEMSELHANLGHKMEVNMTAGTLGDLILTCNSIESRNFRFGSYLATHKKNEAFALVKSTVEGLDSLASVEYFKNKAKTKLRLASFICELVSMDKPKNAKKNFEDFVALT